MNSIAIILTVASLLIILPVGYFAVIKSRKKQEEGKPSSGRIILFVFVVVLLSVLAVNLHIMLINHDERVVAQRYVNSLIHHSVRGDEASFLADVKTIAYDMNNVDEIFNAAVESGVTKANGVLVSAIEKKGSGSERYLYVITEDQALCLSIELKRTGYFYDVYAVTVLDEFEKVNMLAHTQFSLIW